jgi:hypothetical protein
MHVNNILSFRRRKNIRNKIGLEKFALILVYNFFSFQLLMSYQAPTKIDMDFGLYSINNDQCFS